jgi:hypothetical protein
LLSEFYARKKKKQLTVVRQRPFQPRTKIVKPYSDYYIDFIENVGIGHAVEVVDEHDYVISSKRKLETAHNLQMEIDRLRQLVAILFSKFGRIETQFPECTETREVVYEAPIDDKVSIDEAKPLIQTFLKEYFKKCEKVYPSDVADELRIDYDTVREVFAILEREDKLRVSG